MGMGKLQASMQPSQIGPPEAVPFHLEAQEVQQACDGPAGLAGLRHPPLPALPEGMAGSPPPGLGLGRRETPAAGPVTTTTAARDPRVAQLWRSLCSGGVGNGRGVPTRPLDPRPYVRLAPSCVVRVRPRLRCALLALCPVCGGLLQLSTLHALPVLVSDVYVC